MNWKQRAVVLVLGFAPMAAWAHTAALVAPRSFPAAFSVPATSESASGGRSPARAGNENLWTCWFDGAPVHKQPLPAPGVVAKVARAGQVFQAETVEATPFGTEWVRLRSIETGAPLWVPLAYVRRVAPENTVCDDLPIGREQIGPYHGLPLDYRPSDLVALPLRYSYTGQPQRLRAEAAEACRRMLDAAQQEVGVQIRVLSAFRSAQTQAHLCRRKISAAGIEQRDVARPGHSEHQLGTAVDLTAANGLHLLTERFGETREGRWLSENCRRFGFVQSYSRARALREGTPYEPWHFRYGGRLNVEKFESSNKGGGMWVER